MTDTPEDVMKDAEQAIIKGGYAVGYADDLRLSVARAIMAERERCAHLAEGYSDGIYAAMAIRGEDPISS